MTDFRVCPRFGCEVYNNMSTSFQAAGAWLERAGNMLFFHYSLSCMQKRMLRSRLVAGTTVQPLRHYLDVDPCGISLFTFTTLCLHIPREISVMTFQMIAGTVKSSNSALERSGSLLLLW